MSAAFVSVTVNSVAAMNSASHIDRSAINKVNGSPEVSVVKDISTGKIKKSISETHDYFIVQLEDEPLATYAGGVTDITATAISASDKKRLDTHSKAAKKYKSYLEEKQSSFINSLKNKLPNATIFKQFNTVYNGVVIYIEKQKANELKTLHGVKSVHPQRMYHESMDRSHDIIDTATAWESMGGRGTAGAGVKVAIIDGGIRPENPLFSGENFTAPTDLPDAVQTDYCHTIDTDFCNNKLIVARYSAPTFAITDGEHNSPLAYGGHGVHVAGTAVGNEINIEYRGHDLTISGVAPGAYLMVYKGLFDGSGSNIMLLEAFEHAVNDGADVINNSWGGGAGADPATSPYNQAFKNAEAAGVVVVNAAGNDGPGDQTIGCPSCVESGLSVANTTHGRFFANTVDGNGESHMAIDSTQPALTENVVLPLVASINVEAENFEGCDPFTDETVFAGSIALISRGSCAFTDKAVNAAAAGAEGIVVYNNLPAAPFPMAIDTVLPALMVSQAAGEALIEASTVEGFEVTLNASVSRVVVNEFADNVAEGSSRGPNGDANILKPDIAAPGTNILSGASPDTSNGEHFMVISGTSMASPHVAGAAALVLAKHPEWTATQVQTALTSTSVQEGLVDDDAVSPTTPFDIGAGRLNVPAAIDAMLTFNKPSMATAACIGTCSFERSLTNMTDAEGEWTATVSLSDEMATASLSADSITLGALSSATDTSSFTLNIDTSFAEPATWVMGQLKWTHSSGKSAVMPIAVFANESSDNTVLSNAIVGEPSKVGPIDIRTAIANKTFTDEISVAVDFTNATLVEDSGTAVVTKGAETSLAVDETTGKLTWKGTLDTSDLVVAQSTIFGDPLDNFWDLNVVAGLGVPVTTVDCSAQCDDASIELNYNFSYMNKDYTSLTVSSNGFITAGSGANSAVNQSLPSSIAPNNILAPYWADFDLDGTDANDPGAGNMMYARFNVGVNVLVVQWDKVAVYDEDPTKTYTFQVWIIEGSDEIYFTYGDLAETPTNLTIGAENITGDTGFNYHYNGTGNADFSTFDTLQVSATIGGTVDFDYKVEHNDSSNLALVDTADAIEEKTVVIDVLANDPAVAKIIAKSELISGEQSLKASKLLTVGLALDNSSLSVTTQPANGTATVESDGTISYLPNVDFFGSDTFEYTVADTTGVVSDATSVTVAVENVNDAPTLSANHITAQEKDTVNLAVTAIDVDGDDLTYNWTQLSGPAVSFDANATSPSFTAPKVSLDERMSFQVVVNDGSVDSSPAIVTATIVNKKESGSFGWLMLLLTPMLFTRRKKA